MVSRVALDFNYGNLDVGDAAASLMCFHRGSFSEDQLLLLLVTLSRYSQWDRDDKATLTILVKVNRMRCN